MTEKIPSQIPNHIAIIMDGNGRWAQTRGLVVKEGHKKGAEVLGQTIQDCADLGIKHLTVYAFSTENWNRSPQEVNDLMKLLKFYLQRRSKEFIKNGINVKIIGNFERADKKILSSIRKLEDATKNNDKLFLNIAFSYGGRQEILDATKNIAKKIKDGLIDIDEIDESLFRENLYNEKMPYPDLLIRTGGNYRISNFLIWQIAYTELYFTDVFWPDFCKKDIVEAIEDFNKRKRNYGKRT
jgi:undecaprenyl diphosphate synthase